MFVLCTTKKKKTKVHGFRVLHFEISSNRTTMQQEQLMSSREKEIEGYRKIKKKERKKKRKHRWSKAVQNPKSPLHTLTYWRKFKVTHRLEIMPKKIIYSIDTPHLKSQFCGDELDPEPKF